MPKALSAGTSRQKPPPVQRTEFPVPHAKFALVRMHEPGKVAVWTAGSRGAAAARLAWRCLTRTPAPHRVPVGRTARRCGRHERRWRMPCHTHAPAASPSTLCGIPHKNKSKWRSLSWICWRTATNTETVTSNSPGVATNRTNTKREKIRDLASIGTQNQRTIVNAMTRRCVAGQRIRLGVAWAPGRAHCPCQCDPQRRRVVLSRTTESFTVHTRARAQSTEESLPPPSPHAHRPGTYSCCLRTPPRTRGALGRGLGRRNASFSRPLVGYPVS